MPTPWDANFDRPAPPLTIYPQVGPTEQMMHRALRERGLDRPAWDLARRTHTRLVPMEEIAPAGALYVPDTNEIQVGYNADWPIGSAGSRGMYAHELRHARQNESPLPPSYLADAERWAASNHPLAGFVNDQLNIQRSSPDLYVGISPDETDAYITAEASMTNEQMPPYMQQYNRGWWVDGAQPDTMEQRSRGWVRRYMYEDGSMGSEPLERGPYRPRPVMQGPPTLEEWVPPPPPSPPGPGPSNWWERGLESWRESPRPDANGYWG